MVDLQWSSFTEPYCVRFIRNECKHYIIEMFLGGLSFGTVLIDFNWTDSKNKPFHAAVELVFAVNIRVSHPVIKKNNGRFKSYSRLVFVVVWAIKITELSAENLDGISILQIKRIEKWAHRN